MSVEEFLHELGNALSYNDIHMLLHSSPRLARFFSEDTLDSIYTRADAIPRMLTEPLVKYAYAPEGESLLWRGPMDTGSFSLETPDRSYVLNGHVQYGELAGTFTAVFEDEMVIQGAFSSNLPNGVFIVEDISTSLPVSKETYVDGVKQGTAEYYYDIKKDNSESMPYKVYEVDYVNDEAVHTRRIAN
jgi:hypothetical protein